MDAPSPTALWRPIDGSVSAHPGSLLQAPHPGLLFCWRGERGGSRMRRVAFGVVILVIAAALTGCPIPPPGYWPPSMDSSQASPSPVHPGDTVTLLIEASDDQG